MTLIMNTKTKALATVMFIGARLFAPENETID
jgi:hypothetical protein